VAQRLEETRPLDGELAPSDKGLPENFELGIADRSLLEFAGEMDVKNRYASTLMIAFSDQMAEPRCSGVLIGPRLVLTAGSCVCAPRQVTEAGVPTWTVIDGAVCEPHAFVTTVVYGRVLDMRFKEDATEMEFRTYRGTVRPHPELQVTLDDRGAVTSAHADLALILLDEPVAGGVREVRLARAEARVGESLVMAGYGHDEKKRDFGSVYGVRYFRKNPVTKAVTEGRGVYRQEGTYLFDGYAGGPCFREDAEGQWLMGVASRSAADELPFMSTYFFRDWLEATLREAGSPTPRR
jgi:hypothetical protein